MKKRYDDVILATAVIPWNEDYSFNKVLFKKQIEHLISNDITHIYLFGTAGEGYAVNNEQFEEIVSYFTQLMDKDGLYPMVGLIDLSISRMEEKLKIAYKYGIRDFQFSLPSWHELSNNEVNMFFSTLLVKHLDCNFLLYNLGRVKKYLDPLTIIRLGKTHKNFVAVKYTKLSDEDVKVFKSAKTEIQFFLTENNFAILSRNFNCSLLLSLGNLDLMQANAFFKAVKNKDNELTQFYLKKFNNIRDGFKKVFTKSYIDGAYDKMYVKYVNNDFPIRLLPPYECVSNESYEKFKELTKELL